MSFRLKRYFSITSLIGLSVVLVVLLWFFRHLAFQQLIEHEARANAAITQAFANSIWDDYRGFVQSSIGMNREVLLRSREIRDLKQDILSQMQGLNVVKVKIYNLEGLTVFSTDTKQIGEDKSGNTGFQGAKLGRVVSKLTFRDELDAFENIIVDRSLIASYIPIRKPADSGVEAVIEVYSDVTPLVKTQNLIQWIIAIVVLGSMGLLYLFLYYIAGRADRIIRQQENARKLDEEKIRYHAFHDSLTGLPNRTSFLERLENIVEVAQRTGRSVGLMYIDLDRFKIVNDSLGHDAGDLLLRVTAGRIKRCVRESDLVYRIGGDEFIVLTETLARPEDAAYTARRIIDTMAQPINVLGNEVTIGASIGITVFPCDADGPQYLLKNADTAMYTAKESGRNRYIFFTEEMNIVAQERMAMETALQNTIRNDFYGLQLHYQPRICSRSGRIVAVEALLRWHHPEYGLLMPDRFIPVLEETGLIVPVGEWVLRMACTQNKRWQQTGIEPVRVCVNISSRQFRCLNLDSVIEQVLVETDLSAEWLELEITESMLVDNPESALEILQSLKQVGTALSIDDFGAGYSSLIYLAKFPIDYLKIDRCFIKDLHANPRHKAIAASIVDLAHTLDTKVVAEGVENRLQAEFLEQQNCDEMQGFLFSRPLPADQIVDMLYTLVPRRSTA